MGEEATGPMVRLLVTDLDNTLFDWFEIWTMSFAPMLDELVRLTGVDQAILEDQIRKVHQDRRTSEYSGLLMEVPALVDFAQGRVPKEVFATAIERFRAGRESSMRAYPGVRETLQHLHEVGVPVVAYTESQAFYTAMRLRWLELDTLIDVLYSPADTDFPEGVSPQQMRTREDAFYELKHAEHRHTPPHVVKPDPAVLSSIVEGMDVDPAEVVYVGDSLMKDVAMAQKVGVHDVYAAYGAAAQDRPEYNLLQRVSHWKTEDVEREAAIRKRPHVTPTFELVESFDELLHLFRFEGADVCP